MYEQELEQRLDPTVEITRLLEQKKVYEAFVRALQCSDVEVVCWLCSRVAPGPLLSASPPVLPQPVLLSLVQQLGFDLGRQTALKLAWLRDATMALDPQDQQVASHLRGVLQDIHGRLAAVVAGPDRILASDAKLGMHVVNSLLASCP